MAETSSHKSAAGVVAIMLAAMLWSLNGPLIKLVNQATGGTGGASGETIACYRSLLGGLLFLYPAWIHRRSLINTRRIWPIASILAFTIMTACFVIATTLTAAANAILLQYVAPLVVFALSPFVLGVTPRWSEAAILSVAMVGIAVIFIGGGGDEFAVLCLAVAAGIFYGVLMVVLRMLRGVHPATVVAMNFLGSGLLLLPVVLLRGTGWITPFQLGLIAVMSVVQFALPYAIFQWGLQRIEAHRASLITLLEPVLNPLLTLLIVGEAIPIPTLIGGPIILMSVIGWMLFSARPAIKAPMPTGSAT